MKLVRVLTLVAAMGIVSGLSKPAEASDGFSFGYYGPGYSFFPGHYPSHIYHPHISVPYHYFWYGTTRPTHRTTRRHIKASGRCSQWIKACKANWGYGNVNYRGCMRFHSCS